MKKNLGGLGNERVRETNGGEASVRQIEKLHVGEPVI